MWYLLPFQLFKCVQNQQISNKLWYDKIQLHCVSKKVPTFRQILTDFQNFCTAGKRMKFATKTTQHYPPYLKHVATLPSEIKNFLQIFSRYGKSANKSHSQCTNFNSSARVTVYAECIYVFLSKSCPRRWMPCWLLTNTAVTSAVATFRCHRLIVK